MKEKKKHSKYDDGLTDEEEALLKSYTLLGQVKAALAAQKSGESAADGNQGAAGAVPSGAQRSNSVNDSKQTEQSAVDAALATEQARRLVQSGVIKLRIAEPAQIVAARSKARRGTRKNESGDNAGDSPQKCTTEQLEKQAQLRKAHNQFVRSASNKSESDTAVHNEEEPESGKKTGSGQKDYFDFFGRLEDDLPASSSKPSKPDAGSESESEERSANRRSPDRDRAGHSGPGNTVFVECSGLSHDDLAHAASQCGELVSLRYDEPRGRAYLVYSARNDALRAIDSLDKALIRGVLLRADFVRPMQRQGESAASERGHRGRGGFRGRGGRSGRPFRGGFRSPQRGRFDQRAEERTPPSQRFDVDRRRRNDSEHDAMAFGQREDPADVGASFIPGNEDADAGYYEPYMDASHSSTAYDQPPRRAGFYAEAPLDTDGDAEADLETAYGLGGSSHRRTPERETGNSDFHSSAHKRMRASSGNLDEQLVDDSAAARRENESDQMQAGWMSAMDSVKRRHRKK